MTFNRLDRKWQFGAKFCRRCTTNWGQRLLHTSENRTVPNTGNVHEYNIYEYADEALWLPSRTPEPLQQTGITFWTGHLSSDSRKSHFQLTCITGLSGTRSYSSNTYEKKQKWWACFISGTRHCVQDKNWNATIHNCCLISHLVISNVVLSTESLT